MEHVFEYLKRSLEKLAKDCMNEKIFCIEIYDEHAELIIKFYNDNFTMIDKENHGNVKFIMIIDSIKKQEEAKENAKDIINASDTLLEIVNGILDISKIEAGKIEIIDSKYNAKKLFELEDEDTLYIDFYDPTLLPQGKTIEYTNEWACDNNLVDLTFNYGTILNAKSCNSL